ncbi:PREDICTED: potassium channel regulatory protein [Nanorana parkeri]|uniref:potassium channel regulatory protein n=1 Tax=Nanorana parkeri TaxID=125878 RepID=UPI000853F5B7|nr:PREDICTED: potassium channel regulatory protein [Nanorana parkeri]
MSNSDVVTLNVGGTKFTTFASTLQRFPDSRLAHMLDGGDRDFRLVNGQYFVDRDGSLFSYILDYLRTSQLTLPSDFSEYERLQREAEFYQLQALAEQLGQENFYRPRQEILEVRFLLQETHAFFRIFCSCSSTVEALADRIVMYVEQSLGGQGWNFPFSNQKPLAPVPLQRPSHHDLVFQCGTDHTTGDQFGARYVSIKPDQRKLLNGTNVLGLLLDILLRDGFSLVSTRAVSAEEKVECYTFQRKKRPEILTISENYKQEKNVNSQVKQSKPNKKK